MKTVAAISFLDNHSLSMDVENVSRIEMTEPMELDDGSWFGSLIIRNPQGTVVLNLTALSREDFEVIPGLA